jgi:microcystin-dependent protein
MRFGTITNAAAPYSVTDDLDPSTAMPVDVWMPAGPPTLNDRVLYDVAAGQVVVLADVTGSQQGIPGEVRMFAGAAAPAGWLLCDGSSVLRATYPRLFAAIGTTYGSVDGTHFTLPTFANKFARGNTPGLGGGSDTHHNFLSGAGWARLQFTTTLLEATKVTTPSYTGNSAATYAGTSTTSSATTSGIQLDGQTDDAQNVPAYTGVLFIVRT